jgi:hypothetical protein
LRVNKQADFRLVSCRSRDVPNSKHPSAALGALLLIALLVL